METFQPIDDLSCYTKEEEYTLSSFYIIFDVCSLGNDSDVDLDRREDEREKAPKKQRQQRNEKNPSSKEEDQVSGTKNPIISVVLTAHEAIPGIHNFLCC